MNFEDSFTLLIGNEGGFTLTSSDNGNWAGGSIGEGMLKGTKFGISAASYPNLDIENLTLAEAKALYRKDFWDRCQIDLLPNAIRFDLFDTAVNSGSVTAIKLLQKTVSTKEDGIIGPKTITATANIDEHLLDKRFNANRLLFIANLSTRNWTTFGKGWVIRIANNMLKD